MIPDDFQISQVVMSFHVYLETEEHNTGPFFFGHTDIPLGLQRTKRAGKYMLQVSL